MRRALRRSAGWLFIPAGAAACQRDNRKAIGTMLDAGHFALETNVDDIAVAFDRLLDGG